MQYSDNINSSPFYQTQSKKSESFDLRSEILTPSINVSPWNNSSSSEYDQSRNIFSESVERPMVKITEMLMKEVEKQKIIRENNNGMYKKNPDKKNNNDIFSVIINTEVDKVTELITSEKSSLNATDFWGNNLLISLSLANKVDLLKEIIISCIDNFSERIKYDFLIHLASSMFTTYSESVRIELIKLALSKMNSNILNKQDNFGNIVITHCLGMPKILDAFLIDKNIDLEISNFCGNTALSYCVQNKNGESLEKLIEFMKLNYTKEKMQKILNTKNMLMESPFLLAIKSGDINLVESLLNTKLIDPNVKTFDGKTSLLLAIEKNMTEICETLLTSNNSNNSNNSENSGNIDNQNNIDYNAPDNFGILPITKAIELKNYKVIFLLLNKNANLNHKNAIGQSPLLQSLALKYKNSKILCTDSPCTKEIGIEGFSGFDTFAHSDYPKCFKSFIEKVNSNIELPNTSSQIFDVIASKLIKSDSSNVNESDLQGSTPFMLICENNDVFLFNELLKNPLFDPNYKNTKGISSFEYIKEKHDSLLCSMFGNENYCPVTGEVSNTSSNTSSNSRSNFNMTNKSNTTKTPNVFHSNVQKNGSNTFNVDYSKQIRQTSKPNVVNPITNNKKSISANSYDLCDPYNSMDSYSPYNSYNPTNPSNQGSYRSALPPLAMNTLNTPNTPNTQNMQTFDDLDLDNLGNPYNSDNFETCENYDNYDNYESSDESIEDSTESSHLSHSSCLSCSGTKIKENNELSNVLEKIIKVVSETDLCSSFDYKQNPEDFFKKVHELLTKVKSEINLKKNEENKNTDDSIIKHKCKMKSCNCEKNNPDYGLGHDIGRDIGYDMGYNKNTSKYIDSVTLMKYSTVKYFYDAIVKKMKDDQLIGK